MANIMSIINIIKMFSAMKIRMVEMGIMVLLLMMLTVPLEVEVDHNRDVRERDANGNYVKQSWMILTHLWREHVAVMMGD